MALIDQLAEIARPIVQHYHDDVEVHDRRALAACESGDSLVWGCYACGSHLAFIERRSAAESFNRASAQWHANLARRDCALWQAQLKVFGGQIAQWYLIEVTAAGGQFGTVRKASPAAIQERFNRQSGRLHSQLTRTAA